MEGEGIDGHGYGREAQFPVGEMEISWEKPEGVQHRWELPGNYPVFAMVMVIYHYVERIWRILVTPKIFITYTIINKYYPGEPVSIHIQSLIHIIQENNWAITTKKG